MEPSPASSLEAAPLCVRNGRLAELDGIRGLAILLVLIWHYVANRLKPADPGLLAPLWKLMGLSWTGVDLFFVISGFLIGGILLENRTSENYFKTFYVRRVCRIFPLYYLLLLSFFVAEVIGVGVHSNELNWLMARRLPYWSYVSFTQNFEMVHRSTLGANWLAATWSLAVEEQFYLALPVLIRFVPRSRLPLVLLLGIILAPASRLAMGLGAGYILMPCRADSLLLGVLGAYMMRSQVVLGWLLANRRIIRCLFGGLLAGVVLIAYFSPGFISPQMNYWGRSWLALFYLVLLLIPLLNREGLAAAAFRSPLLQKLGIISYGVYMLHQPVLGLTLGGIFRVNPIFGHPSDLFPIAVALGITLAVATIFYWSVEKPILRLGHSFKY